MFRLHYITMYFADIKFPNKESVTTQAFVFSRFKKQTPKSSSWMPVNLDTDYKRNTKWIPDLISKVLPCTATFKLGFTCRHKTHEMIFLKIFKVPFLHVEESPGSSFQMGLTFFFSQWMETVIVISPTTESSACSILFGLLHHLMY